MGQDISKGQKSSKKVGETDYLQVWSFWEINERWLAPFIVFSLNTFRLCLKWNIYKHSCSLDAYYLL